MEKVATEANCGRNAINRRRRIKRRSQLRRSGLGFKSAPIPNTGDAPEESDLVTRSQSWDARNVRTRPPLSDHGNPSSSTTAHRVPKSSIAPQPASPFPGKRSCRFTLPCAAPRSSAFQASYKRPPWVLQIANPAAGVGQPLQRGIVPRTATRSSRQLPQGTRLRGFQKTERRGIRNCNAFPSGAASRQEHESTQTDTNASIFNGFAKS